MRIATRLEFKSFCGKKKWNKKGHEIWGDGNILHFCHGDGYPLYTFVKTTSKS